MLRLVLFFFLVAALATSSANRAVAQNGEIDFNTQIRPIFNQHCVACHGGVKQAGDVSFVYRDQVVAPNGWVVEPGDPDASTLIERVISDDEDEQMPPREHGRALSEAEVALLKDWIKQGAKWDSHWAYKALKKPELPTVKNSKWPIQPLDNFVLAQLENKQLTPSIDAAPERWLRRATLDLTGLPPTIDERKTFLDRLERAKRKDQENEDGLQSAQNKVYENTVNHLLASPRFGERWASVWLDQVRYADSKGMGIDGRRNIWKYRDWVIDAFNSDLPYDEFTVKQMAGDLLPNPTIEDYIATAAHRVTQSNEEGGTDDEEFRIAAVLDRVNTTWQAWQGITFGCVQCHSHPYDPFSHDEYYKFAAFFNNTADTDLDEDWPIVRAPVDPSNYEQASKIDIFIEKQKQAIWESEFKALSNTKNWKPLSSLQAKTNNQTKVVVESVGDHDEFHTVDTVTRNTDFTLTAPIPEDIKLLTAIRFTGMPLNEKTAATDSEWGFSLSHVEFRLITPGQKKSLPIEIERVIGDEQNPFIDPNLSLKPKSNRGFSAYTRIYRPRQAAFILKSPLKIPADSKIQAVLKHRIYLLSAFPLVVKRGHLAVSDSSSFSDLNSNNRLKRKRKALRELVKTRAKIESTSVPVLRERPPHLARTSHVFIRGLFLTKDKEVTPGTPASLPPLPDYLPANRLALAKWMVHHDNPLTARVAVNRIWARLFGIGIVATEEDFGSSGDAPSHPELLDHLAWKFQHELGWSHKKLLKEMVLSKTYRQKSTITPQQFEADPENRWLARGPRHRLSSEMVRDQALAVSNLLSYDMFGKPVHPPLPAGVWKPFSGGDKWTTPEKDSKNRYRRSVYTYMKRSIPYPMFAAFDSPSREICTPRRLRSNTPIQALMMLNSETFSDCAQAFSERMKSNGESLREQIKFGFMAVTCREPRKDEVDELVELVNSYNEEKEVNGELDGMLAVANVLLNLDESLSK